MRNEISKQDFVNGALLLFLIKFLKYYILDKHPDYILSDAIEIHFINMIKYRKLKNKDFKNNLLERWLAFLDEQTPENTLQEVISMDSTIQKTAEKMEFLSSDKEVLRQYHLRNMALSDITTAVNTGIEKDRQLFVENLLKAGVTPDQINRAMNNS